MPHRPLAFRVALQLTAPTADDRTADADRLISALEAAGFPSVSVPPALLRRLPAELRSNGFACHAVLGRDEGRYRLLALDDGPLYGIALDIGTTTLEGVLYELRSLDRLAAADAANPQIGYGADVLSRVQRAMTGEADGLVRSLNDGINGLIDEICRKQGVERSRIYAMAVAGNTIMSHFFLGLDVSNIPLAPNIPAVNRPVFCRASEAGIGIHPEAVVYLFPNAGSYVGGDIVSGMLYTELLEQEEPVLFMDAGTNLEITLGCRHWIMVGAGAAGPALEGGVARAGRRAEKGTISAVRIERETAEPVLSVIGGGVPEGICGSGLIDLVSELYDTGLIDQAGKFVPGRKGVIMREGEPAYLLHAGEGKELTLTQKELGNFLRSKAATFAFLYVFLRLVGMKLSEISSLYVSGALGCGINPESAVNIGMLPDIAREKIIPVGNSSLKGAAMLLLDSSLTEEVEELLSLITYREMSEDPDLLNLLQGALFIPHTDPEMLKA